MPNPGIEPTDPTDFGEKRFYLDEFRGRALLIALDASDLQDLADEGALAEVLTTLTGNRTRIILLLATHGGGDGLRQVRQRLTGALTRDTQAPAFRLDLKPVEPNAFEADANTSTFIADVWESLRNGPIYVGVADGAQRKELRNLAQRAATRLGVHKLVLLEPEGGLRGKDNRPISFLDEAALEALLGAGEAEWTGLHERLDVVGVIRRALLGGVPSVNLCSLLGASRELFTYEGSGTLFTLEDYCTVDRLGIDIFEEAERLIERGQREGVLKPREPAEIAAMLANGFGATINGRHLAGFAAFITAPYAADRAGEVVGLYTITRFKGEGVGGRLLTRILDTASNAGLAYVFATTTSSRAQSFFERQGFSLVGPSDVPAAKWSDYDEQRRARAVVLRRNLKERA